MSSDDLDFLIELNSDPEVMRFISGRQSTYEEVELELAQALGARWLAFGDDDAFLGWAALSPFLTTTPTSSAGASIGRPGAAGTPPRRRPP